MSLKMAVEPIIESAAEIGPVEFWQDPSRKPRRAMTPQEILGIEQPVQVGHRAGYGDLQNCGVRCIRGLNQIRASTEEQKQNIVYFLLQDYDYLHYLYAPATDQIIGAESQYTPRPLVLDLFDELGAKEIARFPNQYHNPNDVHLCLLNLHFNPTILKYVDIFQMPTKRNGHNYARAGIYVPRWFTDKLISGEIK